MHKDMNTVRLKKTIESTFWLAFWLLGVSGACCAVMLISAFVSATVSNWMLAYNLITIAQITMYNVARVLGYAIPFVLGTVGVIWLTTKACDIQARKEIKK